MPFPSSIDTTAWAVVSVCMRANLIHSRARCTDDGRKPCLFGIAIGKGLGRRAPDRGRREVDELGLEVLALQRLLAEIRQTLDDLGRQLRRTGEGRPGIDVEARQGLGD